MIVFACSSFEEEPPSPGNDGGAEASPSDAPAETGDTDAGPGCPKGECGQVLAQGETNASEIAADGTRVFWTIDQPNGLVRTIDPVSGMPKTISGPEDRPKAPVVYNNVVYYATNSSVHVIGKNGDADGGTNATVAASTTSAGTGLSVTSIQRAGGLLFFTGGNKLFRCTPSPNGCGSSGVSVENFPGAGTLGLTLSTTGRLWFSDQVEIVEVIFPYEAKETFTQARVRALVVDETRVFFVVDGSNDLLALPLDGSFDTKPTTMASGERPFALAVDATAVYFTRIQAGTVTKVPKSGAPAVEIATQLGSPKGIAIQNDRVLVVENGRILSLPKGN